MFIEEKKMAVAGLLGLAALACMGSTAQAQMTRGGRMGGMTMGGMMGGMRGSFMAPSSPRISPMMGTGGSRGGFNPSMALVQPRLFGSSLNLGGGLTNFGVSGLNSFRNAFAMPFRGGYGMGGYGYGMGGYGMSGYGAAGGGYGRSNGYGAGSLNYGSSGQQVELPHPAGDVKVAPADAAVIRLRVPHQFAAVSFNGQSVSGIGTTRTYVTPKLEAGKSSSYEIKATWNTGNGQKSMEKVVEARPGQISTTDFTRKSAEGPAAP